MASILACISEADVYKASEATVPRISVSPDRPNILLRTKSPSVSASNDLLPSISNEPERFPIWISVDLKVYPEATEEAVKRNVVPEKSAAAAIGTLYRETGCSNGSPVLPSTGQPTPVKSAHEVR